MFGAKTGGTPSIFINPNNNASGTGTATGTGSIFGGATGGGTGNSIFGAPGAQTTSIFGGATQPAASTGTQPSGNLFSKAGTTTTPGAPLFGNPSSTGPSIFGATPSTGGTNLQASFGPGLGGTTTTTPASTPTTGGGLLPSASTGNASKEPAKPLFGTANMAPTTQPTQPAKTGAPIFGQPAQPTQPTNPTADTKPLFGGLTPSQSTENTGAPKPIFSGGGGFTPTPPATTTTTTTAPATGFLNNLTTPTPTESTTAGDAKPATPLFTNPNPSFSGGNADKKPQIPIPTKPTEKKPESLFPNLGSTPTPTATPTPTGTNNPNPRPNIQGMFPTDRSGMEETRIPQPNAQQPPQPQDPKQKIIDEYEKSNKTTSKYLEEWEKALKDGYIELRAQCETIKSFSIDRGQNYEILQKFKQLEPAIKNNKERNERRLNEIESKQNEMLLILNEIRQELGDDGNLRYSREHPIAVQLKNYESIRKEVNAEDKKTWGEPDNNPSNQQMQNIFFNLNSVQNEISRMEHVLQYYFGKSDP